MPPASAPPRRTPSHVSDSTCPRAIRAMYVNELITMMKITVPSPGWMRPPAQPRTPQAAPIPRPMTSTGKARKTSTILEISGVDPAAVEARQQADDRAHDGGDGGSEDPDLQRDPRAVDRAREDVAAELIDAEWMGGARAQRAAERVGGVGVIDVRTRDTEELDDQRREDRDEDEQDDESGRDHGDAVRAEPPPEQLARRPRRDLLAAQLDYVVRGLLLDQQL